MATSLVAAWTQLSAGRSAESARRTSSPTQRSHGPHHIPLYASSSRPRATTSARRSTTPQRYASTTPQTTDGPPSPSSTPSRQGHAALGPQHKESSDASTPGLGVHAAVAELTNIQDINTLMQHPALLDNVKAPRHPIVLCHGLYGFDVRGPFWGLEIHYWAGVLDILRKKVGAEVIVRGVPGTGAIADRAQALHDYLASPQAGIRGKPINFIGHSMGGLDARYLISVLQPAPEEYIPVSLTTLNAPHRGSPFMDWCNANVGTGNERVEAELRDARAKRRSGAEREKEVRQHRQEQQQKRALEQNEGVSGSTATEDFEKHVVSKPPFTLKTPLFVRPSAKEAKATVDATAKSMAAGIVETATSPTPSSEGDKKKNDTSSSLLNLSTFTRALSSIGGSFSSYMLSVLDQPAYAMLSTRYMAYVFNPMVPDVPTVSYFSVASRKPSLPIYHPLWLSKLILDAAAESRSAGGERDGSGDALGGRMQGNDGLVSVESARWGTFLGVVDGCDHWDLRGGGAPRWAGKSEAKSGKTEARDKVEEDREEEGKERKAVGMEKKESTWIDINRIIGRVLTASVRKGDGKKGAKAEQSVRPDVPEEKRGGDASAEDQSLIDEVAAWISARLPQGDTIRRAEAEKAADRAWQRKAPRDAEQAPDVTQTRHASRPSDTAATQTWPSSAEFDAMRMQVKLRREAALHDERGHEEAAHQVRQELAWHQTQRHHAAQAAGVHPALLSGTGSAHHPTYLADQKVHWNAQTKERMTPAKEAMAAHRHSKAPPSLSSSTDLERFWIALCRHLWSRGF